MKKYIKPELFYERYELAQHIADCDWEMTLSNENTCLAFGEKDSVYEGISLFVSEIACDLKVDLKMWEDYCYTSGSDGQMKVFAS